MSPPGPRRGHVQAAPRARWLVGGLLLLVAARCSGSSSSGPSRSGSPSTPSAAATPTSTASGSPIPGLGPNASLEGCPGPRSLASVVPFARFGSDVDDLLVTADGHVWASSEVSGVIDELDAAGRSLRRVSDPQGPEGLVELPGGRLAVAEQKANRIELLDRASGRLTPLISLRNTTGKDGVDGIALDAAGQRLLVPDSPNGTLLTYALDGSGPTVLARGLGRPVSAALLPDGSIAVATENAPGAVRVAASGAVTPLAALGDLDEVVVSRGLVYAADLGHHAFSAIDPATGRVRTLVTAAPMAQGVAIAADGRVLLADSTRREIVAVDACR